MRRKHHFSKFEKSTNEAGRISEFLTWNANERNRKRNTLQHKKYHQRRHYSARKWGIYTIHLPHSPNHLTQELRLTQEIAKHFFIRFCYVYETPISKQLILRSSCLQKSTERLKDEKSGHSTKLMNLAVISEAFLNQRNSSECASSCILRANFMGSNKYLNWEWSLICAIYHKLVVRQTFLFSQHFCISLVCISSFKTGHIYLPMMVSVES